MRQRPLPLASAYAPWAGTFLFEISWEVCNQVGGIYQVLRSKAATMVQRWEDDYLLVGSGMAERYHSRYFRMVPRPATVRMTSIPRSSERASCRISIPMSSASSLMLRNTRQTRQRLQIRMQYQN